MFLGELKKLNFDFLQGDDILEAVVDGGFYHVAGKNGKFHVRAHVAHENFYIGDFNTIYAALDAANYHYFGGKAVSLKSTKIT